MSMEAGGSSTRYGIIKSLAVRELDQLLNVTPQGMHFLVKSIGIQTIIKNTCSHLRLESYLKREGINIKKRRYLSPWLKEA